MKRLITIHCATIWVLLIASVLAADGGKPNSSASARTGRSASDFLTPDGRFDLNAVRTSGYQGPLDLKGVKGVDVTADAVTSLPATGLSNAVDDLQNVAMPSFTLVLSGDLTSDRGDGGAWGDYNNDGQLEVLVRGGADSHGVPRQFIYQHMGDGRFIRVDSLYGVNGQKSLWLDFDNDGLLDVFTLSFEYPCRLHRNNGNGTFSDVTTYAGLDTVGKQSWGAAFADYDVDGDVDIFVANHARDAGNRNALYSNNGDGTFTKVVGNATESDIDNSEGSSFADYDNDGWPDLFVANYGTENGLFHNNGNGTFTRIHGVSVVGAPWATGCAWGDYNNDGYLDLAVITLTEDALYRNNGDGTFDQVVASPVVSEYSSSRGCSWGDLDNDGDLDLIISNGYPLLGPNMLFANDGHGMFTKITTGVLASAGGVSGGTTMADYDRDGDLDLLSSSGFGLLCCDTSLAAYPTNRLFQNDGNGNAWIVIRCIGKQANRQAIGARIRVHARINDSTRWQTREICSTTGSSAQNSSYAHFGLGDASIIDTAIVIWPSLDRTSDTLLGVAVNQLLVVEEGIPTDISEHEYATLPATIVLEQNYPNPFNPTTTIAYSIPTRAHVTIGIFNLLGHQVRTLIDEMKSAGKYKIEWEGTDANGHSVSTGVYLYRLTAGDYVETRKMVLLK